jgi:hypothetical protein
MDNSISRPFTGYIAFATLFCSAFAERLGADILKHFYGSKNCSKFRGVQYFFIAAAAAVAPDLQHTSAPPNASPDRGFEKAAPEGRLGT